MDPDIRQIKATVEDTNRTVHKMLRAQRWSRIFSVIWWAVIIIGPLVAFKYFFGDYLSQIMSVYQSAQSVIQQYKP